MKNAAGYHPGPITPSMTDGAPFEGANENPVSWE